MRTDDGAQKPTSLESNNKSVNLPTPREQTTGEGAVVVSTGDSDVSTPVGNGNVVEEVKEVGARVGTEPSEVIIEEAEVAGEATPSSESFGESGESSETLEASDGVLTWAPEEDHEHKRVKVCLFMQSTCSFILPSHTCNALRIHYTLAVYTAVHCPFVGSGFCFCNLVTANQDPDTRLVLSGLRIDRLAMGRSRHGVLPRLVPK